MVFRQGVVDGVGEVADLPEGGFVASQCQEILKTPGVDGPGEFGFVAFGQGVFGLVVGDAFDEKLSQIFEGFDAHLVDQGVVGHDQILFGPFDIRRCEGDLLFEFLEGVAGALDTE